MAVIQDSLGRWR